jgi:heme-degrading monooxygenase HmoA
MSIHQPKRGKEHVLIDSMRRYRAAWTGKPGVESVMILADDNREHLVGLAIWKSRDHWASGVEAAREAIKDDPFDEWESQPPDMFELEEV